jgi:hypothetical protein
MADSKCHLSCFKMVVVGELQACDLVCPTANEGCARRLASAWHSKTHNPARFAMTDTTRQTPDC